MDNVKFSFFKKKSAKHRPLTEKFIYIIYIIYAEYIDFSKFKIQRYPVHQNVHCKN